MIVEDLAQLPIDVAMCARVDPNGEISWPIDAAERAIGAFAAVGYVILGLDLRQFDQDKLLESAWSAFHPADDEDAASAVERARDEALAALARVDRSEFGEWILITWALPGSGSMRKSSG